MLPTGRCALVVYEDEREVIATNVSTCGLQKQSNKAKLSSHEVFEMLRPRIEYTHAQDKTIITRTFQHVAKQRQLSSIIEAGGHMPEVEGM